MLNRIAALALVLWGISLIAFTLTTIAPGDPAFSLLEAQSGGATPSAEAVEAYRVQLGLDAPAPVRYLRWLANALQGNLGFSYRSGQPVAVEIANRLPATLTLALVSLGLAVLVGVPLGVFAAIRRGSIIDLLSRLLAIGGAALPSYILSLGLVWLFAVTLGWLPAFGAGTWRHLALPTLALASGVTTQIARLTRASMLDVLGKDYVRTARAKGLHEQGIVTRHVLRNALLPVVTALGVNAGNLLSGAVIVERIFSWPGIGKYAVDAIFLRDYPVIQGVVVYFAVVFVGLNLLVDVAYRWLDPQISFTSQP
ncbi:MAG: ABC transporter permease [Chloroflexales bacterium]|nr:ABC transporter permease [Chloroflexales bacterium]